MCSALADIQSRGGERTSGTALDGTFASLPRLGLGEGRDNFVGRHFVGDGASVVG